LPGRGAMPHLSRFRSHRPSGNFVAAVRPAELNAVPKVSMA
jgi:hypothetical protein